MGFLWAPVWPQHFSHFHRSPWRWLLWLHGVPAKIFKMWIVAFILCCLSLLTAFPSHIASSFMNAICSYIYIFWYHIIFYTNRIPPFFWFLWKYFFFFFLDYNIWQCIRNTIYIFVSWCSKSKFFIEQSTLPTSSFSKILICTANNRTLTMKIPNLVDSSYVAYFISSGVGISED